MDKFPVRQRQERCRSMLYSFICRTCNCLFPLDLLYMHTGHDTLNINNLKDTARGPLLKNTEDKVKYLRKLKKSIDKQIKQYKLYYFEHIYFSDNEEYPSYMEEMFDELMVVLNKREKYASMGETKNTVRELRSHITSFFKEREDSFEELKTIRDSILILKRKKFEVRVLLWGYGRLMKREEVREMDEEEEWYNNIALKLIEYYKKYIPIEVETKEEENLPNQAVKAKKETKDAYIVIKEQSKIKSEESDKEESHIPSEDTQQFIERYIDIAGKMVNVLNEACVGYEKMLSELQQKQDDKKEDKIIRLGCYGPSVRREEKTEREKFSRHRRSKSMDLEKMKREDRDMDYQTPKLEQDVKNDNHSSHHRKRSEYYE